MKRYESEIAGLRARTAGVQWRRRLTDLRRIAAPSSLVKKYENPAVSVMHRLVKRRRRRLAEAFADAGSSPARLHRIRLKIKALRYLLEGRLPKSGMAKNTELKLLRQIQHCLGDMHDEENVLKTLRAERTDVEAARNLGEKLKLQKRRQLHDFKKLREALTRLWGAA